MAAVDYFLKIDGIVGDSVDAQHKGEISVESFSWGMSNSSSHGAGGGGGAGKATIQDFHFVSSVGQQSPQLMLACATGSHIKTGMLTCRKAGERQQEFLKVQLFDVFISSYQVGGTQTGGDPIPRDQFSINFTKIEMTEVSTSATGTPGATAFGGFDFLNNKVIPPPVVKPPGT